jgi:hypothetical protein
LTALIKTRLRRMQYRPGLLTGFLAKTGLDFGNFRTLAGKVYTITVQDHSKNYLSIG